VQKRMFKVITPIDKKDGGKYWMRVGSGFLNKDDSINIYLDAIPLGQKEMTLQLREMTDEDFRRSSTERGNGNGAATPPNTNRGGFVPSNTTAASQDATPF
jgi:hypothetical protein